MDSEQVNYLIWRYLQESGFDHTAFVFHGEAKAAHREKDWSNLVSVGALINMLQCGIHYMEAEALAKNKSNDKKRIQYSLLGPVEETQGREKAISSNSDANIDEKLPEVSSSTIETVTSKAEAPNGVRPRPVGAETQPSQPDEKQPEPEPQENEMDVDKASWNLTEVDPQKVVNLGSESSRPTWCVFNPTKPERIVCGRRDLEISSRTNDSETIVFQSSSIPSTKDGSAEITSISWNASGDFLAVAFADGIIFLCDVNGGHSYDFEVVGKAPAMHMAWSSDTTKLACALPTGVVIYDLMTLEPLYPFAQIEECAYWVEYAMVTISSGAKTEALVIGGEVGVVIVRIDDMSEYVRYSPHKCAEVSCVRWNENMQAGVAIGTTKSVYLFDKQHRLIIHPDEPGASITSVTWVPDTQDILVSCASGNVYLYNTQRSSDGLSSALVLKFSECTSGVVSLCISPDKSEVACGLQDGDVVEIRLSEGVATVLRNTCAQPGPVRSVTFDSTSTQLAFTRPDAQAALLSWTEQPAPL